jgi:ATP-dependent DNA ligase
MTYRFPLIVDVSKRKDSCYRRGGSSDWLKSKNPTCAAVKRGADED